MPIPIADLHCDTAIGLAAGRRLDDPDLQVNLPAMADAGIGLQVFACYVPPAVPEGRRFEFASRLLDGLDRELGRVLRATSPSAGPPRTSSTPGRRAGSRPSWPSRTATPSRTTSGTSSGCTPAACG